MTETLFMIYSAAAAPRGAGPRLGAGDVGRRVGRAG